ncbi:hypothetical protein GW17_00042258 [Ensete ventricosum]|nr:hypothetical protein GW17_00042258 [Ensete ventricosum]RZR97462.1 hypothetical protein BHM03_00026635 [Ensete ventricosum]
MEELSYNQMLGQNQALGIRPRFRRCSAHREFARNTPGDHQKLVGNTLGDYRKKIVRLAARISEAAELDGVQVGIRKVKETTSPKILAAEPSLSNGYTTAAQVFKRLTAVEPPGPCF